jgi:hypothetical protein
MSILPTVKTTGLSQNVQPAMTYTWIPSLGQAK